MHKKNVQFVTFYLLTAIVYPLEERGVMCYL